MIYNFGHTIASTKIYIEKFKYFYWKPLMR